MAPVKMNGGDMETETEEMEGDVELAIIDEEVGKKAAEAGCKRRAWVCVLHLRAPLNPRRSD